MRLVAGARLVGAMLTGGLFSTCVSSCDGAAAAPVAKGGGEFAAGATPDIVLLSAERTVAPGRGKRDPVSALDVRPSVAKTAPMRKL